LICSMSLNFVSGVCSALVSNQYLLLCARFFSGMGAGGAVPVTFTYYIEFFGSKSREQWIIYLTAFWCVGAAFVALAGWVSLPETRDFWQIARWRVFFVLISLPSLMTALCLIFLMDTSPKFLLMMGKREKLSTLLDKIAGRSGHEQRNETFNGGVFSLEGGVSPYTTAKPEVKLSRLTEHLNNIKALYSAKNLNNSIGLGLLWFTECFAFYGWVTFQPTYVEGTLGKGIYFESLLGAAAQLVATLITAILILKLDVALVIGISCFLSAAVLAAFEVAKFYYDMGEFTYYVLWALFSFASVIGMELTNILQGEAFETKLRSTAFGFNAAIGRIGAVLGTELFGMFGKESNIPVGVCAVVYLISAAACKIPEAKRGRAIN